MNPRISVLCCARQRVDLLERMLSSLYATAEKPEELEVILRCDYDDRAMLSYLQAMQRPILTVLGHRMNGYASLPVFTNQMARLANAERIFVVNDDAVFETSGWDTQLMDAAASLFPDEGFLIGVDTVMNAGHFPFPFTSKTVVNALGCIFDERLVYTDIWLRDVLAAYGRAKLVPVRVRHAWNGMTEDQQHALATRVQDPTYPALYAQCVTEGVAKLKGIL